MRKKLLSFIICFSLFSIAQAIAQPPSTVTIESWYMSYTMTSSYGTDTNSDPLNVAFDGNDVYFELPTPFGFKSWVKGTITDNTATFPKGQLMGEYGGAKVYLMGSDGKELFDVVFLYDSNNKVFTANNYVLYNNGTTELAYLASFYPLVIQKEKGTTPDPEPEEKPDLVTPPEGLQTAEYAFSATNVYFDNNAEEWVMDPVKYNVRLGIDGINAYLQGLCRELPMAWIKGKYDASDNELNFPSGQYYGSLNNVYDFFFAAANYPVSSPAWTDEAPFIYNTSTGVYSCTKMLTLNSSATKMNPYEIYTGAKLVKIVEKPATPATPKVVRYTPYSQFNDGTYGLLQMEIPVETNTGENLLTDKLFYRLYYDMGGVQSVYTFQKDRYKDLAENMTLVPYNYYDYDFYMGGSAVFFYDDVKDADKVGVQSVYTGGNETHESEIAWFDIKAYLTGVNTTESVESKAVSESYTDLQGRKVSSSTKGLMLKTTRMSDGTVKTVKVVRK